MSTISEWMSTRELRSKLSDVLGRVSYAGERFGVLRNGKKVAVIISVEDLHQLVAFQHEANAVTYEEAIEDLENEIADLRVLKAARADQEAHPERKYWTPPGWRPDE